MAEPESDAGCYTELYDLLSEGKEAPSTFDVDTVQLAFALLDDTVQALPVKSVLMAMAMTLAAGPPSEATRVALCHRLVFALRHHAAASR